MSTVSPYSDLSEDKWESKTKELIADHPLDLETIRELSLRAWSDVWSTQIGTGKATLPIRSLGLSAPIIGAFFEKLLAKHLELAFPNAWRGGTGSEKDLHFVPAPDKSIEVKTSGQLGLKIFGNRSYSQELASEAAAKKDKSGYYITANFFEDRLCLLRFGWIDASDWKGQAAATGQASSLPDSVYRYKLLIIGGEYALAAPVGILNGVGETSATELSKLGITNIKDLLDRREDPKLCAFKKAISAARDYAKTLEIDIK